MNMCIKAVIVYSVSANNCRKEILSLRKENHIQKTKLDAFGDKLDFLMTSITKLENDNKRDHIAYYHAKRSAAPVIAFHVYASRNLDSLGVHQTIQFDIIMTNEGNGYNKYTGTFIVPSSGFYVFTWTIDVSNSVCATELVVNGVVIGISYPDSSENENNAISTTAVKQVSLGEAVAVRARGCKHLRSDTVARCSFSGWKL
ncbi:heavy metal-binding protein HIP-like [Mytilus trossulus]|uniref:heavy metal-binding protein HIP-like n=1 Tax=Mytilus trossulus TaxID=6551 RepID=UPI0030053707